MVSLTRPLAGRLGSEPAERDQPDVRAASSQNVHIGSQEIHTTSRLIGRERTVQASRLGVRGGSRR